MKSVAEKFIEILKKQLPACYEVLEWHFDFDKPVLINDKNNNVSGMYQDHVFRFRIGSIPKSEIIPPMLDKQPVPNRIENSILDESKEFFYGVILGVVVSYFIFFGWYL